MFNIGATEFSTIRLFTGYDVLIVFEIFLGPILFCSLLYSDFVFNSLIPPSVSTRCCLGNAPSYLAEDSWPTLGLENSCRLRLERFSSVGRGPTLVTKPSMQLDVESGTICRRTSDSWTRTSHTVLGGGVTTVHCKPVELCFRNALTYLLNYLCCRCWKPHESDWAHRPNVRRHWHTLLWTGVVLFAKLKLCVWYSMLWVFKHCWIDRLPGLK